MIASARVGSKPRTDPRPNQRALWQGSLMSNVALKLLLHRDGIALARSPSGSSTDQTTNNEEPLNDRNTPKADLNSGLLGCGTSRPPTPSCDQCKIRRSPCTSKTTRATSPRASTNS